MSEGGASFQLIVRFFRVGGWMMLPLCGVGLWIGYLLILRTLELMMVSVTVRRGPPDVGVRASDVGAKSKKVQNRLLFLRQQLIVRRKQVLSQTLITSAPLMGLLGTVSGMITTFRSLADGVLFQPSGGIAGGIAQALLSTQFGLGIALPALLWQRLLQRRAIRLSQTLAQQEVESLETDHA